jgi:hypothetical protein
MVSLSLAPRSSAVPVMIVIKSVKFGGCLWPCGAHWAAAPGRWCSRVGRGGARDSHVPTLRASPTVGGANPRASLRCSRGTAESLLSVSFFSTGRILDDDRGSMRDVSPSDLCSARQRRTPANARAPTAARLDRRAATGDADRSRNPGRERAAAQGLPKGRFRPSAMMFASGSCDFCKAGSNNKEWWQQKR